MKQGNIEDGQLSLTDISFGYEERLILERINLGLMRGSFISIVGPNGSGKSTLLRLMSAGLKPKNGVVLINGEKIENLKKKELAKKMSFVPQTIPSDVPFTAKEIVLMSRYPYLKRLNSESEVDFAIVEQAMKYTNTLSFSDRLMKTLSGGERQRVILAQAIAQEPEIMLLDEPVSNLDLLHQVEILNLLKRLCIERGITVIAILHDLNMATTYSDFALILSEKKIAAQGIPEDIFTTEKIKEVFDIDVTISLSPVTHKPYIYTHISKKVDINGFRVHILCGGGSGSGIIKNLNNEGYEVSVGVLSAGDMDWQSSKELNLKMIEIIPFTNISREAYERNLKLCEEADLIILAPAYFGKANRLNAEIICEPSLRNKKKVIIDYDGIKDRDFTDGHISELLSNEKVNALKINDEKELYLIMRDFIENK